MLRTASALELRLWVAALLCLCASIALGLYVSQRTPARIDVDAVALRGTAVDAALFFTALGRWPVLLGLGLAATAIAYKLRTGLTAVAIVYVTQILSQGASTLLKLGLHRTRPDGWLMIRETDFSYPSGHAATAVVFFVGFAILAWHAPFPRPAAAAISAVLLVCAIGIPWSRLALGAHYLTDVIGGLLLGAAFLCAALALIVHVHSPAAAA
ncbi:MAG TPA: phosphatase PAP2 family protein [Candidatus Elarobacter sp.]|nr:phosphatase PAP2 family protein [Candidatus Elarobacter sp.]